ncbi:unnamed protein product [Protopolystoma xenopodis]|uniref:Uncharacterized protein n=1 Tax=Protopolystoma xenopodis TaxID=117903 RepID=A0A448WUH4_9PLAT|nr:unnamed protein product [Protopolystoma xenopodis]
MPSALSSHPSSDSEGILPTLRDGEAHNNALFLLGKRKFAIELSEPCSLGNLIGHDDIRSKDDSSSLVGIETPFWANDPKGSLADSSTSKATLGSLADPLMRNESLSSTVTVQSDPIAGLPWLRMILPPIFDFKPINVPTIHSSQKHMDGVETTRGIDNVIGNDLRPSRPRYRYNQRDRFSSLVSGLMRFSSTSSHVGSSKHNHPQGLHAQTTKETIGKQILATGRNRVVLPPGSARCASSAAGLAKSIISNRPLARISGTSFIQTSAHEAKTPPATCLCSSRLAPAYCRSSTTTGPIGQPCSTKTPIQYSIPNNHASALSVLPSGSSSLSSLHLTPVLAFATEAAATTSENSSTLPAAVMKPLPLGSKSRRDQVQQGQMHNQLLLKPFNPKGQDFGCFVAPNFRPGLQPYIVNYK